MIVTSLMKMNFVQAVLLNLKIQLQRYTLWWIVFLLMEFGRLGCGTTVKIVHLQLIGISPMEDGAS
ncbi:hypothetical protein ASF12_23080 [Paenibacillus sp. Leaf72]|nr:hypothetical protein ASF12_23080 [Paenibacillus sp. Leaf72]